MMFALAFGLAAAQDPEEEIVLGAPRDYRHDGFQQFATCSGSGARQHTMAQSTITFSSSCSEVSAEIQARASGDGGWKDPHNRGTYAMLATEGNVLKLKRRTGNNRYTDVITFALTANGAGCMANACSQSQGNSNNDAGANMCNMGNLFCNSGTKSNKGVACKPVNTDLQYTVTYMECGRYRNDGRYREHDCQNFQNTCLVQPSELEAEEPEMLSEIVLGAPRDYRHDGFQQFATCSGSGARQHTMAQSTISFGNSCTEVSEEIQARANGQNGWKDPHNRGTYAMLATEGNVLKMKRRTGNNKYTDVITYALTANGAGCNVNACSQSQGNSNNDAGANMCNMGNLYCNSATKSNNGVACKPVNTDLQYTVTYQECGRYRNDGRYREHDCQNYQNTCLRQPSELEQQDPIQMKLPEEIVLGAPRDYRHDGFQQYATCSGSGARQHTMAQSFITFQSSCSEVSAEIQARANGDGGWKDPHNRGTYTMLATEGNVLKMKRRTGNNKYTDVITFALVANGAGCNANACSQSQGNSNNDAGANMCNMGNLFCNSGTKSNKGVACKPVNTDLQYTVTYMECGRYRNDGRYREHDCQNFQNTCLLQPSSLEEEPIAHELKYLSK